MSELVRRLREFNRNADLGFNIYAEAADEIERLRERLETADAELTNVKYHYGALSNAYDASQKQLVMAQNNHKDVVATKRITDARLRIALDALQKIYDESCEDNITLIAGEAFEEATHERSREVALPDETSK